MASTGRISHRWSALPRLVENAPPRVVLIVGVLVSALGAVIATHPLTSIALLGVYVGVSAIVTGIAELASPHRAPRWWTRAFALAWIAGGLAVLIFLGRSLDFLPTVLAVLLGLGGLVSLGDAVARGTLSQRVLAATWGIAQIVFAVLSRAWPDVTVLIVAFVFGVRTLVFGVTLIVRGVRRIRAARPRRAAGPSRERSERRSTIWTAAGRYALSAVLVATASGGWWLADWVSDGAPVVDAFYDPPDELPSGHGRLVRYDDYLGRAPQNGEVTRILYTTRDAVSRPAVASALVIVPDDPPPGPRPVVIWNHGTTGVAQGCAPSLRDASATRWAIPALEEALAAGWVVVASDYSGQGAPGNFPYLIGKGEARSSLDAVLAAGELDDLTLSPDTVVWGHSQGGHAALWTTLLAPEYTPGVEVLGTAAVAPAADPLALADALLTDQAGAMLSVLTSWVLVPYADTYPDVHLDDYVVPGARSIVQEMTQRCPTEPGVVVSVIAALGVSEDRPLYAGDLTGGALGRRLAENAATAPTGKPLLVAWGGADEVIPTALQREFVTDQCAQGQPVRWITYPGQTHLEPIQPPSNFPETLFRWSQALIERTPLQTDRCDEMPWLS
jgi:uncharacterized membrane protein HdeD (DUF308 family)/acetyl esterase/lipase